MEEGKDKSYWSLSNFLSLFISIEKGNQPDD